MGGRDTLVSIEDWPGVRNELPNVTGSDSLCNRIRFSIGVDIRVSCEA